LVINSYFCINKCPMSTAELKELRREVKQYLDHADERIVTMIRAMLEADLAAERGNAGHTGLTQEQEVVLDQQIELYEKGQMEFSTWEDARTRITSRIKNGI
jgi:hypothetical protein